MADGSVSAAAAARSSERLRLGVFVMVVSEWIVFFG
jgi:alkanesulfonate monooxygenase SsuD/methylene tetrahydromethanopterin reductase-like flavin-dependent oxidoreductase (luciferase family)